MINGLNIPQTNQHTIRTANIHCLDVSQTGTLSLNILGASHIIFKDDKNNEILNVFKSVTVIHNVLQCGSNVNIAGN